MTIAHVVPSIWSDQTPHEIGDGACWCQPLISAGQDSRLVIHRRYMDGPVRDPDDDQGWSVIRVGDQVLS